MAHQNMLQIPQCFKPIEFVVNGQNGAAGIPKNMLNPMAFKAINQGIGPGLPLTGDGFEKIGLGIRKGCDHRTIYLSEAYNEPFHFSVVNYNATHFLNMLLKFAVFLRARTALNWVRYDGAVGWKLSGGN